MRTIPAGLPQRGQSFGPASNSVRLLTEIPTLLITSLIGTTAANFARNCWAVVERLPLILLVICVTVFSRFVVDSGEDDRATDLPPESDALAPESRIPSRWHDKKISSTLLSLRPWAGHGPLRPPSDLFSVTVSEVAAYA